ncbi:MAG: CopG family ribbon-helix-helix protein [Nitrosotalea sp.]
MTIITISLNEEMLSEMEKLQKALGFSARSGIIRAGIRGLISEEKQRANLSGHIHAVLMVVHDEKSEEIVTATKHRYEDLIGTHLHNKIQNNKCMDLFLLHGDAEKIGTMTKDFKINRKMDMTKFVAM